MVYNAYVSPLTQRVTRERLLPLSHAAVTARRSRRRSRTGADGHQRRPQPVDYEPDPEKILRRLVPDYVEISIYRALVESTAGFFGAQMTAMRSASENAGEIITEYTLQMNRARQAEITQEIMEVVAGAEGLQLGRSHRPTHLTDTRLERDRQENRHNGRPAPPPSRPAAARRSATDAGATSGASRRSRAS